MKTYRQLATLLFLLFAAHQAAAQDRLELSRDVFYNDSIFTGGDSLFIKLSVYNNSTFTANSVSVFATNNTIRLNIIQGDSSTFIAPFERLDTIIVLKPSQFLDTGVISNIEFTATSTTNGIIPASESFSIFYNKLPNESAWLNTQQNVGQDSFKFNTYYPLRIKLRNTGNIDYFFPKPTELRYSINGSPAMTFFSTNSALVRNGQNHIDVIDSIPISDTYFKKGGGNIVVVWPVGFARVDSVIDTIVVDWPLSMRPRSLLNQTFFYPNPASGFIHVKVPNVNIEHVRILNINQHLISTHANVSRINIGELKSGVYFIELRTDQGMLRQVLVKQ